MKNAILALSVAFSLTAVPAIAQSSASLDTFDLDALTAEQLDSLVSILSGLPGQ